jgi:hypothetical protein
MRRIFTSTILVAAFAVTSLNSFGQACTGTTFTAVQTYDFASSGNGTMGFTGDFARVNNAGGQLSADVGATSPTTKTLTSPTLFAPNSATTIRFGFDLGGTATVTSYTIQFLYNNAGTITPITVCSSSSALANGTYNFAVSTPTEVLGHAFEIRIIFGVSGNSNNTITIDNFRTNVGGSNIALPVKFQSLDAKTVNSYVSLKWNVATEENLSGYSIERSADGRNFSQIAFVNASGETNYSFVDNKPGSVSYYRIKSVDINGKYGYSTVALVKSGKSMIVVKAFPSPVIKNVSIQHPTAIAGSSITISSADGRVIKTIVPAAGMQQTDVDLSAAKSGLYLVRYNSGNGESETLKILKQ